MLGLCISGPLFSGGTAQGSGSSSDASVPVELREVIPPQAIQIDEYISRGAYDYPLQGEGPIQVFTAGDLRDTTGYLQVGLRAKHTLPPLNIGFVIDKSNSMREEKRIDWVKAAFRDFMDQVRPEDVVSLVIFDASAKVLIPPTQVKTPEDKQRFMDQVSALQIGGRSDIYEGMALGYTQVAANYRKDYINRVICLSDGDHNAGDKNKNDILCLVETYRNQDITLSTVALGESADFKLMVDTALIGGGNARFISEPQDMAETFGRHLDRLVLPAARMLKVELRLAEGVSLQETWGYEHQVLGTTVHYTLGTLYNEDIKTLVAEVQVQPQLLKKPVDIPLGAWYLEYRDQDDVLCRQGPYPVALKASALINRKELQHPWIQESEGFIHLGRGLIHLGNQALEIQKLQQAYDNLKKYEDSSLEPQRTFRADNNGLIPLREASEGPVPAVKNRLLQALKDALQETEELAAYLRDLRDTLGEKSYEGELLLLTQYQEAFSRIYARYGAED
ncbi:MAG: VWA domain-containing protein [Treponema sp.]|jgi:hypothetical protein|nr:VWA domain-containing protein [Treponema sp.]